MRKQTGAFSLSFKQRVYAERDRSWHVKPDPRQRDPGAANGRGPGMKVRRERMSKKGSDGTTVALDESSQDCREIGRPQYRFVGYPKHRYKEVLWIPKFGEGFSLSPSGAAKRQSGSGEIGGEQHGALTRTVPSRHATHVGFDSRLAESA